MNRLGSSYVLICALLFISCSVEKRTEEARAEIMEQYNKIPNWDTLPEKNLSWSRAIALLENNLEIQRAKHNVKEAELNLRRVYTEFIPMVDLGYYYNTALLKSNNSYPAYNNFDVNVIFNIPALTRLPIDHYTRSLALFKAQKDLELKRREQVSKLWQAFREYRIEQRRNALREASPEARLADKKLYQAEQEMQSRSKSQELARLLNDYSTRWKPVCDTLPDVRWKDYRKKATVPDDLTQISMALTLEVARLQKLGIAIRYLPDIHINFYSPSLFSLSGGNTEGFFSGGEDIRLNLNSYLQLDTRLDIWSDWAMAKENYKLIQQELTQQMYEYRNKIDLLLESWKNYDEWKQSMHDYINFRRNQGVCDPDGVKALYTEDLSIQQEVLEQEQKNIERECALIQEYGLPSITRNSNTNP